MPRTHPRRHANGDQPAHAPAADGPSVKGTEQAVDTLGCAEEPLVLRIPFSHFCKKVEWGLTYAGVPYRALDVTIPGMRHIRRANPVERTVPVLAFGTMVLPGSHPILRWADSKREPDTPGLFPKDHEDDVVGWESWADTDIGPAVRRESYRTLERDPTPYARNLKQRVRLRLGKRMFAQVNAFYKTGDFDDTDPPIVRDALTRVAARVEANGTGYLFGDHVTAADLATAALMEPLVPLAKAHGYQDHPDWEAFCAYVDRVRPKRLTRTGKRPIGEADWRAFEVLNAAALAAVSRGAPA